MRPQSLLHSEHAVRYAAQAYSIRAGLQEVPTELCDSIQTVVQTCTLTTAGMCYADLPSDVTYLSCSELVKVQVSLDESVAASTFANQKTWAMTNAWRQHIIVTVQIVHCKSDFCVGPA